MMCPLWLSGKEKGTGFGHSEKYQTVQKISEENFKAETRTKSLT